MQAKQTNGTIPEQNRFDDSANYGRPQWKVSYYSQKINAGAMSTFNTRHDAIGYVAQATREGWMERPSIKYRGSYDFTPSKHYK